MAKKLKKIEVDGKVLEILPGYDFRIQIQGGAEVTGSPSGKMRMFNIRIMVGDYVKVELSPYDLTKGRVTYRYNQTPDSFLEKKISNKDES